MRIKPIVFTLTFFILICLLTGRVSADPRRAVRRLNKHCSTCHPSERVFNIEKTSIGWTKTVNWMRKHSANAFSQKQAALITQNIIDLHPNYAKQLFQLRCVQCHGLKSIEKLNLSPQQWQRLVLRERAKAITWISLDEAADISAYLAKTYPAKNSKDKTEPVRAMVEKKCLRCHIHSTVFKPRKTIDQWISVNKRMRGKSPELINDQEVLEISKYLNKVNPLPEWQ